MRRVVVLAVALGTLPLPFSPTAHAQTWPGPAPPYIELEKTRFALTEQVFFWLGLRRERPSPLPSTPCHLTTTRPDGSEKVEAIGDSPDGPEGVTTSVGGHRLGPEPLQVGRYALVLECAGQKTAPAYLTVEDVPILKDIDEVFEFSSPLTLILGAKNSSATLVVRNRSNQTIRFPYRGEMLESVHVELTKTTGEKSSRSFFVPPSVLLSAAGVRRSDSAEYTFTWALANKVHTVVLAPGGTYRLKLSGDDVLGGHSYPAGTVLAGEYDVQFSTVLQVLIGERDGPWAEFSPVRLDVRSSAHASRP